MSRVTIEDSPMNVMMKLSDGNPGAAEALMTLYLDVQKVDPATAHPLLSLIVLDAWEIYGSSIYVLWSDKCGRETGKFVLLLRATQLGHFPVIRLQQMAADQRREVNIQESEFTELLHKVLADIPDFNISGAL